ncbi:MAG: DUF4835 family protein [Actinobacteria bacterium]|nr:DUF4835 family protein [Actinomycetota bacterium]
MLPKHEHSFLFYMFICLFFAGQFIFTNQTLAQRVEGEVTTDIRTLPIDRQDKLRDFAEKVQHYINSYDWDEDPWQTIVYINVQLILEDMSSGAQERYKGTIVIDNNYDIQFSDKRWRFAYQSGEQLIHEENAMNSFTNMIDFYIYIILGHEFDKWSTLGGSPYYEKARHVAEQSKFGLGRYIDGWDRRLELVNYFLSDRHKLFREMLDYYFYGLSFVNVDNAEARKHCATAIKMLDKIISNDPENEYAKKFIDAHHIEMTEIFRRAKNKEPIRTLLVLDPAHERMYRDILRN